MRKIILTGLFLATSLFATQAIAQSKFGHINTSELVLLMPETKVADESLKKYNEELSAAVQNMIEEYRKKVKSYQDNVDKYSEVQKELLANEVNDLQARIEEFQQSAQEKLSKKREDVYGPILKKAEDAIKAVAQEGKYAYIFDTSTGAMVYSNPSDNVMELVKKKLGVTATTAPAPEPKK